MTIANGKWRLRIAWGTTGGVLLTAHLFLLLLSERFAYEISTLHKPIVLVVSALTLSGLAYLMLLFLIPRTRTGPLLVGWILVVGLLMRWAMGYSTPILEDDYYRYLWDGAVTAQGISPYAHSPAEAALPILQELSASSNLVAERVNHPELRTVYPPVSQAAFALAHWLKPWSLQAWRGLILIADIATLLLLAMILVTLGRSPLWIGLYWWNPLLVKELFNSAHMDALLLPLLLLTLLLRLRGRICSACLALALATAVKLWPVLLLPLVLRPAPHNKRRLVVVTTVFGATCGVLIFPMLIDGFDSSSGLLAYGYSWEMNDPLFMTLAGMVGLVLRPFEALEAYSGGVARAIIGALLLGLSVWFARQQDARASGICERFMLLVAAVFLLSPTQYPWYYTWLLPFLAINPRFSLLLLTVLLPLYYLRFHLAARENADLFDYGIVWLEYLPVWLLFIEEWRRNKVTAATRDAGSATPHRFATRLSQISPQTDRLPPCLGSY